MLGEHKGGINDGMAVICADHGLFAPLNDIAGNPAPYEQSDADDERQCAGARLIGAKCGREVNKSNKPLWLTSNFFSLSWLAAGVIFFIAAQRITVAP